ncbi:MAG TPA: DUF2934 domain-containing protein [Terriglobales bacterium]|nr:DUF2934 domain-containing protein [Terriglobales bacterium]
MARAKTPRNGNPSSKPAHSTSQATSLVRHHGGSASATVIDLEDQIRQRAYEIYEERGRTPGHEEEDWIQAEREVHARYESQFV